MIGKIGSSAPRQTPGRAAFTLDAFPPCGELCALSLDERLVVSQASPGCDKLWFDGVVPEPFVGVPVAELFYEMPPLEGTSGSLDLMVRRRGRPRRARAFWSRAGQQTLLLVVDLERVLAGEHAELAGAARLASEVVHEVRNPLSSVKMVVQTLERANGDGRASRKLIVALREIRAIERIVSALAGLIRVPWLAPGAELEPLLAGVLTDSRADLARNGVRLLWAIDPGLPPLRLDRDRLALLLQQLIGVLSHGLEAGEISLEARRDDAWVEMRLSAAPEPTWRPAGIEFSLALARAIAREHGGSLIHEAEGSFLLRLPIPSAEAG